MRIGLIGSGNIGSSLAKLLVEAGHEVVIANSRGPSSLAELLSELGDKSCAATVEEAARLGEIVIEAIPFGKLDTLPAAELEGKVLITAANYYPGRDGEIELQGLAESEYLLRMLPKTHIGKAFNTIYFQHLRVEGDTNKPLSERRVLPFAASDDKAEQTTRALIEELGFGPLYLGNLAATRGVSQPNDKLYNKQLTLAEAEALLR